MSAKHFTIAKFMFPCCFIIPNTIQIAVQIWYTYKHIFGSKIVYMVHSYRDGGCGLLCSPDSYEPVINCSGISIFVNAQKSFFPDTKSYIKCHHHINGFIDLIKPLYLPNSIKIHIKHHSDTKIPDLVKQLGVIPFQYKIHVIYVYTCMHVYNFVLCKSKGCVSISKTC